MATGIRVGPTRAETNAQMERIKDRFKKLIANLQAQTVPAVRYGLAPIKERADYYCPVDTGALKDSGYLEVRRNGTKIEAEIGYAKGGNPRYAVIVHERTDVKHKSPTRAKWLQVAAYERLREVLPRVAHYLGGQLR